MHIRINYNEEINPLENRKLNSLQLIGKLSDNIFQEDNDKDKKRLQANKKTSIISNQLSENSYERFSNIGFLDHVNATANNSLNSRLSFNTASSFKYSRENSFQNSFSRDKESSRDFNLSPKNNSLSSSRKGVNNKSSLNKYLINIKEEKEEKSNRSLKINITTSNKDITEKIIKETKNIELENKN